MTQRANVAIALLSVLALSTAGRGQTPTAIGGLSDPPVFRARVDAVTIDVFVTDEAGNPVSGLTINDFELEENGKRQDITTFRAVDIPLVTRDTDWPPAEPDVASNDRPEGRIFVFANAVGDPCWALRTRAHLRNFVNRHLGPDDLVAVVNLTTGLATDGQDFTGNRRLILTAIDKISGDGFKCAEVGGSSGGGVTEIRGNGGGSVRNPVVRAFRDVVDVLGRMPGRHKSVLVLSEGPHFRWADLIDYQGGVGTLTFDDAHAAMTIATRNNIAVYPIDPRGLTTELGITTLEQRMELRALAEITGGFAHLNSNEFEDVFARIVRDASTYYMLGFNSDYRRADGKFVRLNVRVKRPGLVVRTRSGYVSQTRREQALTERASGDRPTPVAEALGNPITISGHPIGAAGAAYKKDGETATVIITVETALTIQAAKGRTDVRNGRVELRMIATDAQRRLYPEIRHSDTLSMPTTVADATGGRVRLVSEMTLPTGRHQIRIASGSSQAAGSVVYDLEVPDFNGEPLTMSSLALAARGHALPTVRSEGTSKKVKTRKCYDPTCTSADIREVPVTAWAETTIPQSHPLRGALPAPPTTLRAFTRSEAVTLFAEVYDNRPSRAISVRAELRPTSGPPALTVAREISAADSRRPSGGYGVTVPLSLADVAPGRYVLRLEATAPGTSHTAAREIPIDVLP